MTVTEWFQFWQAELLQGLSPNTKRNYRDRFELNIKPIIGDMRPVDVKPMHCKIVLNRMEAKYAGSTIRQAYIAMGSMFKSAKMNQMIDSHPMDGVRYTKPVRAVDDIHYLTVEEQEKFLDAARSSHNFYQYALILETGLRTGEMIGLTWDAIDWEKRTLTVNKTLEFRHNQKDWRAGPPKNRVQLSNHPFDHPCIRYSESRLCHPGFPQAVADVIPDFNLHGSANREGNDIFLGRSGFSELSNWRTFKKQQL